MKIEATPISHIGCINNNNIYVKRDDLIPFSFGGNKVRIAEEFFADMSKNGCDCIIGYGNARSNLSRAIANLSASKGIECIIVSASDDDGTRVNTSNSSIVSMCNGHIEYCNKYNVAETIETILQKCINRGKKPYYIYGDKYGKGNEATPVEAYVKTYKEIHEQSQIKYDYIFLATGTGMTQAGLIVGQGKEKGQEKIVGISISRTKEQAEEKTTDMVEAYIREHNLKLNDYTPIITDEYLAGGYGKYDEKIVESIKQLMVKYGIPLDVTYTGKAFSGMLNYIEKNNITNKNILFLHTGGTPLFFDDLKKMEEQ